jgi:hypothetical protein
MVKNFFKSLFLSFFIINQVIFLLIFVRGKIIGSKSLAVCHIRDIIKGYFEVFLSYFRYVNEFKEFLINEIRFIFDFISTKFLYFIQLTNSNELVKYELDLFEKFFILSFFIINILLIRFLLVKLISLTSSKILTPNLFVYYPTSTALNSFFIRFMGINGVFFLFLFFFFCNLNLISIFIIDCFCIILCWSVLIHFLYAFDHNITQSEKNFNFDVSECFILNFIGLIKFVLLTFYLIIRHFTKDIKITISTKNSFFGYNIVKPF